MAQTYLNDNMSMPYPFYGYAALPFSMSCIVGLGVCVRGEEPDDQFPVVASSVAISEDSVNLAIGRYKKIDEAGGTEEDNLAFELIGTIYANTAGYSVYVPASFYTTYGDGESIQREIEQVLARYAGQYTETPVPIGGMIHYTEDDVTHPLFDVYYVPADTATVTASTSQPLINAEQAAFSMAVYYTTNINPSRAILSTAASTGYMVLGVIPMESVGVHEKRYALDPSCVTYIGNAFGQYNAIDVNGEISGLDQTFTMQAGGLVGFEVEVNTVTLVPNDTETLTVDDLTLSVTDYDNRQLVTSINGHPISATAEDPTPTLEFVGQQTTETPLEDIISWEWARWSYSPNNPNANKDTITLELNGTSKFPNCYEVT